MKLRPVTFVYKNDPSATRQYGLVAEEVAQVYPELVAHDLDGKIQTVRYSVLTSMLVNELQKCNAKLQAQAHENQRQALRVNQLSAELAATKTTTAQALTAMQERLATLEQAMQNDNGNRKLAAAVSFQR
jgi:hypothetical protein